MAADPLFLAGEILPAGKLASLSPDPQPFTPVWTNVTLGTSPTNAGWAWQKGREVGYTIELILGTGGDVTGAIEVDYPTPADPAFATSFVAQVWASEGATNRFGGTAVGDANGLTRFAGDATSVSWTTTVPFNWVAGSILRIQGSYIAAP